VKTCTTKHLAKQRQLATHPHFGHPKCDGDGPGQDVDPKRSKEIQWQLQSNWHFNTRASNDFI